MRQAVRQALVGFQTQQNNLHLQFYGLRRSSLPDGPHKHVRQIGERTIILVPNSTCETEPPIGTISAAARLNAACLCKTLDRPALRTALDAQVGKVGFAKTLESAQPSLFSRVPVFVTPDTMTAMAHVITAVEAVVRLPGYRDATMAWATPIAKADLGPAGALMGYDFHITPDGPRLIEINTNAGGAFLNSVLADSQRACCSAAQTAHLSPRGNFGTAMADMFVEEWQRQHRLGKPATIAIVDDAPEDQYLFPEFQLAEAMLKKQGFVVVIADASALVASETGLTFKGVSIDLVYNRLVDFRLDEPRHAALRAAYELGRVVVTPNPHVHALVADKRNLSLLSNDAQLKIWGLAAVDRDALRASVPPTVLITPANADALWHTRRSLFFKPARGHGSKAAYRGDKLTRRVWAEILDGEYVAQEYASPSERIVVRDGLPTSLKVDIRLYSYAGAVLLAAARLYQGQTTNMRTPGGGFSPVLELAQPISQQVQRGVCQD